MSAKHETVDEGEESWLTRGSLAERLRHQEGHPDWQKHFENYWKLIYSVARACDLSEREAEEVVQETILETARSVETSRFNPAICTFKSWLMQITRWQVARQLRNRQRRDRSTDAPGPCSTDTEFLTASLDPNVSFGHVWEAEWQKNLEYLARERVKQRVSRRDYQIYYLRTVKEKRMREVARLTGANSAKVYLVHHRLASLVKKELTMLRAQQPETSTP